MPSCLLGKMDQYAEIFDAVEYNAMYAGWMNFNLLGERWARRHRRPMVGNGDVHRLEQLGTTYSLVDARRSASSICEAIAAGRVRVVTRPLATWTAIRIFLTLFLHIGHRPSTTRAWRVVVDALPGWIRHTRAAM
jgi:hypothetical protein